MDDTRLKPDRLLADLRPHPRLIVDQTRLTEIRDLTAGDAFAATVMRNAINEVMALRLLPPPTLPLKEGLSLTKQTLDLLITCGLVWRLDRDPIALATARDRLVAICSQPAWNRDNFLAIGELAYALAIGYDWLRDDLSEVDRELVHRYLVEAILKQGLAAYDEGDWWIDSAINWNHECNGGLIIAALAVADSDPDLARAIIPRAVRWFDGALDSYEPDGAWDEGAGYWYRATVYSIYTLAALESALGCDFELSERTGLARTGAFYLASVGPTGLLARYADCSEDRRLRNQVPALLWLARRYDRPEFARAEIADAERTGPTAAHLLWYRPTPAAPQLPLDHCFRGPGPVAMLRSAWDDPRAVFMWLKGGNNQVNHGHLDQGTFEFDALGQRWVRDLGTDDYGLPGYFERQPGGRRWGYFRLNSLSHSVPLIDGANQQPAAIVRITGYLADRVSPRAVADLSEAYKPAATLARRGIMLVERRAGLVQDEFTLAAPCRFTWALTTDADIAISGTSATLTLGGEQLIAHLIEPAGAVFTQESAERPPPEAANTGVRRLLIDLPQARGRLRIAVLLAPCWPDGNSVAAPAIRPLGCWF
jgi:hypothetical protein